MSFDTILRAGLQALITEGAKSLTSGSDDLDGILETVLSAENGQNTSLSSSEDLAVSIFSEFLSDSLNSDSFNSSFGNDSAGIDMVGSLMTANVRYLLKVASDPIGTMVENLNNLGKLFSGIFGTNESTENLDEANKSEE